MSSFSNAAFIQPSPPTALQNPSFATHPSVPISMSRPTSSNPGSTLTEESCSPRRTFLRELSHKALQFVPRTIKVSFWWLLSWFVPTRGRRPTPEGQQHSWCQASNTRDTYKWRSPEWMVGWPLMWCTYRHCHRCPGSYCGKSGLKRLLFVTLWNRNKGLNGKSSVTSPKRWQTWTIRQAASGCEDPFHYYPPMKNKTSGFQSSVSIHI